MFPTVTISHQRVANLNRLTDPAECLLTNGSKVTLAPLIAAQITPGDDISFPLPDSSTATAEILVTKSSLTGSGRDVYQAPIGYASQPKKDKRDEFFVAAGVRPANLGISSIFLPCKTLREYFYRISASEGSTRRQTLYDVLQVPCTAAPGELRVAFKLRQLVLEAKHCPRSEHILLERAFNILGDPGLRACYDALLKDPEAPALFPYGGFGSLLVSGERSRDGQTFFARRIIGFLPERHKRRFHTPLRKCEFYSDRALYRDICRRLELWIDPAVLAAYGLDCLGMATPEHAMGCCEKMRCHSHHHGNQNPQDCCKTTPQMQATLGQPSSVQTISVSPVTLGVMQAFDDSKMSEFFAIFSAGHSHDPPLSGSVSTLPLCV